MVNEESLLTFTAEASDPDNTANPIIFSLDPGYPAGASINDSSGLFTWTPTEAQGPGAYSIVVRASDKGPLPNSASLTVLVIVNEVNRSPALTPIGSKAVDEGSLLTFTARATDPDVPANTLTFSLDTGAPSGASIDGASGVFNWTPTEAQGPGVYTVTVRVRDNGTPVLSASEAVVITVNEANRPPELNPIGNKAVAVGSTLTFTVTATDPDYPPNALTFGLDAGAPAGARIISATGVFSWTPAPGLPPGDYTVTIRVYDSGTPGLSTSETISVTLYQGGLPPVANFIATPVAGLRPLIVAFNNQSIGEVSSQQWDFGDGANSSLANPVHAYTSAGAYTVTLVVSGSLGSDTFTRAAYIRVYEPVAAAFAGSPTSGVRPLAVTFTNQSAGYSDSSWNFGDGITSTEASPVHTFTTAGTYSVTLTVVGPGGSDSATRVGYVTVYEPATADFTASPTSGYRPLRVGFVNRSSGEVSSYLWNFGDGSTSTLASPYHTYSSVGVYTVTLTASGLGGANTVARAQLISATTRPPDFSGEVNDPTATHVSGSMVEMYTRDRSSSFSTTTPADGSFSFDGLAVTTYYLRAHPPAGSPYADSLEVAVPYNGIPVERSVITLTNPIITGTVTTPDGSSPVSRTVVSLHSRDYTVSTDARTDDNGYFKLGLVPNGSYVLEAYPLAGSGLPYGRSQQVPVTVNAGIVSGVASPAAIALTGASVAGTVFDPAGATPVAGSRVTIHSADWRTQARAVSNDTGYFSFGNLAAGSYLLEAESPVSNYFRSTPRAVTVDLSRTNYYTMPLTAPNLAGQAVRSSEGVTLTVRNARVVLQSKDNPAVANSTTSDGLGRFAFGLLAAGDYWLKATPPSDAPDLAPPAAKLVTIQAGSTGTEAVVFGSAPMHLEGSVVRSSGTAVTDATISASRTDGAGTASGAVDGQGRYRINLGPGAWMVTLKENPASSWIYDQPSVRVAFPDTGQEITRMLNFTVTDAPSTVSGQLAKEDGTPPGTARVGFHTGAGLGNSQPLDADGAFSIQLAPGSYNVDIWLGDTSLAAPRVERVVLGPGETRDLGTIAVRSRNSRVTGYVVDANGAGVSGIEVIGWLRGSGEGELRWSSTTSIDDGVFNLNVVSGTWEINASPAAGSRYMRSNSPARVEVGEGETRREVTIGLTAAESEIKGSIVDAGSNLLTSINGFATATSAGGARKNGVAVVGGTFTMRLPADTYTIDVQLPSGSEYTVASRPGITVAPGASAAVDLTATAIEHWIRGSLVYAETPVTGLRVGVFASSANGNASTQVDPATGEYSLRVPSGTWYMNASVDASTGYVLAPLTSNVVSTTGVVTSTFDFALAQASGRIQGVITAPGSGGAVRLGGVRVEARDASPSARERTPFGADSDANGVYTMTVPPGRYSVNAYAPADRGYLPPPAVVVQVDGASTTSVDVRFQYPSANILGTVSLQGEPVSSGMVRAYSAGGAQAQADIASDGTYSLSVTADDTWTFQAVREAGSVLYQSPLYRIRVAAGSNALDLALSSTPIAMPESASATFEASAMQVLLLSDGTEVRIPAGALASTGLVTVRAMPRGNIAANALARPIGLAYDLLAVDGDGATISRFRQNIAVILHYTNAQLEALGIQEDEVMGSYWDAAAGNWRRVPNVVQNKEAKTITIYTDHFSSWTITGSPSAANLSGSRKTSSLAYVAPNQTFTYTVVLSNTGAGDVSSAMTDTLPAQLSLVSGSSSATAGAVAEDAARVRWSGSVTASQSVTVTFVALLNPGVASGQLITNSAIIADGAGGVVTASNVITAVVPDLSTSTKSVNVSSARTGAPLTYDVVMVNSGSGPAVSARMTDTIPVSTTLLPATVAVTGGTVSYYEDSRQLRWQGSIGAGQRVTVTFGVLVATRSASSELITNIATIDDGVNPVISRSASTTAEWYKVFLPVVARSYGGGW
ncbi:MAG: carboxypeptidase regulatory-like domain-containing protein [Chloroflexi bacterium]|nr:carboxypeptidase regulatory-like domain-containing protein [Chloroflexota bacterium]